jgi:hypothetical protein
MNFLDTGICYAKFLNLFTVNLFYDWDSSMVHFVQWRNLVCTYFKLYSSIYVTQSCESNILNTVKLLMFFGNLSPFVKKQPTLCKLVLMHYYIIHWVLCFVSCVYVTKYLSVIYQLSIYLLLWKMLMKPSRVLHRFFFYEGHNVIT